MTNHSNVKDMTIVKRNLQELKTYANMWQVITSKNYFINVRNVARVSAGALRHQATEKYVIRKN